MDFLCGNETSKCVDREGSHGVIMRTIMASFSDYKPDQDNNQQMLLLMIR